MKKTIALLFAFLLMISSACADGIIPGQRICQVCGNPTETTECLACGSPKECWVCYDCLTKNLSDTCMKCGKSRKDSLAAQAADPRALTAWPAVSCLAAEGDPENLLRLGTYYQRGIVVGQDIDQALALFRKSGEAGYAPAWLYMGKLYDGGIGVAVDLASALDCYQKAADLGSAEACWYVGSFYEEGDGVTQSYSLALDYYLMAADKGDADSLMPAAVS